ncbi:MAG: (2Fe-2S)-binding protein [Huintestinicola sp.]
MENIEICHCMHVTLNDIDVALHKAPKLTDVTEAFKEVQEATACSTGCGGCYDKILDTISELMHH